ncbi:uncharacterized protein CEXT_71661 [Caerostris extrusa]|uniref:Mutator-like transposase domain-containing protein n=1 Tax=Caerostris extrusa TaxID=172846 RepID=A0AAV4XZ47_CAEEX|nr:uncharacterized protein CEXT_71661 [Caerostris extrusa]
MVKTLLEEGNDSFYENLKSYGFNQQESVSNSLVGNRIIDIETLSNVFSELSCTKCYNNDICLFEDSKYGLCSHFTLKCDGTWQRRGHTSLNGCVAVLSIDTGKVLDLEVMSSYCPTCRKLQKMHKNAEYVALKADHICQCNYEGSSAKMESVGAHRIFSRSVKSRQLKYTTYYGDELCSRDLLQKCLHGKTQNANESFNGTLWRRGPKEVFAWLKTVKIGAYDAAIQFNEGYMGCPKGV